ncbi:MAG: nqrD [Chlamydiales bacterium]|jgi:Na+-transporting NADH:ubiquinone oxidoreductase subunit D|nr:nqrD [Chlamydiales bacterium]
MSKKEVSSKRLFLNQLWNENPILLSILGICSALAVTSSVKVSLTMGISVTLVTAFSSFFVSLIRNYTPDSVRMITQLAVISSFVITVDQFLRAYMYDISKVLSVFVGLIITNCIVMGRAEAMAKNVPPVPAFFDGLGAGASYGIVLLIVAVIRELFGFGTLYNIRVIPLEWYATPQNPDGYQNFGLMVLSPAAFFILAGMIWVVNIINSKKASH